MNARFLAMLLLPLPLLAQTTVRGIVTEQNSGNRPIAGVQIKALGSAPEASDNAGAFQLVFAGKKPGERIVVSELAKKGYEIVNKDVVSNWLIPADPQARTKIVMCPEGALARNILKYYDISLSALTRGYNEQLQRLQAQRDSALLDARAYGEQAQALAERFAKQQEQLEQLAERFARENFDDCSEVHRRAFEAFSQGRIEEAIRILESVNSEEEIAKAKVQREKGARMVTEGDRMVTEGRSMQTESDSVIRRNIDKLIFQADLYAASNRFADAERTYLMAAGADTTYFRGVSSCAEFLKGQGMYNQALRWVTSALAVSRTAPDSAVAFRGLAAVHAANYQQPLAEQEYGVALAIQRALAKEHPRAYLPDLAELLSALALLQKDMNQPGKADTSAQEALAIRRDLIKQDPNTYAKAVVNSLVVLGHVQGDLGKPQEAETLYLEAIAVFRASPHAGTACEEIGSALNSLATVQIQRGADSLAEQSYTKAIEIARRMAAENPDGSAQHYAIGLNNLAHFQQTRKNYDSAEVNYLRAIAIVEQQAEKNPQHFNVMLASFLRNLANMYDEQHSFVKAEALGKRCLEIVRTLAATNPQVFAAIPVEPLYSFASIYMHDNKADSAETLYAELLVLARTLEAADSAQYRYLLANVLSEIGWDTYKLQMPRAIEFTIEARDLFQRALGPAPDMNDRFMMFMSERCATCCRRLARYMILTRKFSEAEAYARQDLSCEQYPLYAKKNLAHSLIYLGRYDEALPLYEELKDKPFDDQQSFRDIILRDLDEFENAGVTHPDLAKVRALFNAK